MKKLFLSLVAVLCCSASLFADDDPERLVATLNHNGALTAFYGITAFAEAMENAENGDEITLSGGNFYASMNGNGNVTYNKAVTIRGAGIKENVEKKTKATCIASNITFNLTTDVNAKLYIEGINFDNASVTFSSSDLADATFSKCNARSICCQGCSLIVINFIGGFSGKSGYCLLKNCLILENESSENFKCRYEHCDIVHGHSTTCSVFYNCIFNKADFTSIPYGSTFFNCILTGSENSFAKSQMESCYVLSGGPNAYNSLFIGRSAYNASYPNCESVPTNHRLTDESKSLYPANDDTEVGIYGGEYPYTDEVNIPFVTKIIPGNRTSNGKLPVTIEVK